ncbi:MAG: AraC family transcriptional regulator, partial [Eubacteriales bacterium]|nr:AraC family transcriptional regulator [Eubacteriales bacterium]
IEAKEECQKIQIPYMSVKTSGIYILVFIDRENQIYVMGPACTDGVTFKQRMDFLHQFKISDDNFNIATWPLAEALNNMILLYMIITGENVDENEILSASRLDEEYLHLDSKTDVYEIQEFTPEKQHMAYQDELNWQSRIEKGTVREDEEVMTPQNIEKLEQIGILAKENSQKQYEYMAVTSTCLASRAAIRGGVNAQEVYELSERFLQKISKCSNTMEYLQIHRQVAVEFSKRVQMVKERQGSDLVNQCKNYIARHRKEKFELERLAEALAKNPSYLSRKFSEETGMTMQDFAMEVKLEAVENLLKYSDATIADIAEYLHFHSQSYLAEKFRKQYGMSPSEYRKKNQIHDNE